MKNPIIAMRLRVACALILTILLIIQLVFAIKEPNQLHTSVLNYTIGTVAVFTMMIELSGTIIRHDASNKRRQDFSKLLFSLFLTMLFESLTYMPIRGGSAVLDIQGYVFYSTCFYVNVYSIEQMARYLKVSYNVEGNHQKYYFKFIKCYRYLLLVALLLNLKYHTVFGMSNGVYERGPLAMAVFFMAGFLLLGEIPFVIHHKNSKVEQVALYLYIILPILSSLMEFLIPSVSFVIIGIFMAESILYVHVYLQQGEQLHVQRLELEKQKGALMLSQIKPHFLYNTLTTIAYLCRKNPSEAEVLTNKFSLYLRSNIDFLAAKGNTDFSKELENTQNYLSIEKYRFGDRVNVEYDIGEQDFILPMLTLQPIVENAVKHGICKREDGGTVKITTRKVDNFYQIVVSDDGVGFDTAKIKISSGSHIGLSNVSSRIEAIGGTLKIESKPTIGTTITITIPMQ